ncbi:hypothetical protein Ocin01_03454 [Orchesella cincta]|uniref:Uncharacterized protein n=1 Tax=Orchesella cincta TaxID=48709 RepID=A0A1D2ND71_ORCCI|nr:hypothetical protein Ocin01_03454 [Orchesella cincta]
MVATRNSVSIFLFALLACAKIEELSAAAILGHDGSLLEVLVGGNHQHASASKTNSEAESGVQAQHGAKIVQISETHPNHQFVFVNGQILDVQSSPNEKGQLVVSALESDFKGHPLNTHQDGNVLTLEALNDHLSDKEKTAILVELLNNHS